MPDDHEQSVVRGRLRALREWGTEPCANGLLPDHMAAGVHAGFGPLSAADLGIRTTVAFPDRQQQGAT